MNEVNSIRMKFLTYVVRQLKMSYNKLETQELIKKYISLKYNIDIPSFSAVLTIGESKNVYFLELIYHGIWYSISNKHPLMIQESKQKGSRLLYVDDIGLTKEEYFNYSIMYNFLEIIRLENVKELTEFIYNELLPLVLDK